MDPNCWSRIIIHLELKVIFINRHPYRRESNHVVGDQKHILISPYIQRIRIFWFLIVAHHHCSSFETLDHWTVHQGYISLDSPAR